jgi:hypothetical protein
MSTILTTLRVPRIKGISIFDLVTAFLGMVLLALFIHKLGITTYSKFELVVIAILLTIPLGIIVHYVLGIHTVINSYLGL